MTREYQVQRWSERDEEWVPVTSELGDASFTSRMLASAMCSRLTRLFRDDDIVYRVGAVEVEDDR